MVFFFSLFVPSEALTVERCVRACVRARAPLLSPIARTYFMVDETWLLWYCDAGPTRTPRATVHPLAHVLVFAPRAPPTEQRTFAGRAQNDPLVVRA